MGRRTGGGVGGADRQGEWHDQRTRPQGIERSRGEALAALETAARVLADTRSVLVIDWPSRDVPASLVFAGFTVFLKGRAGACRLRGLGT